MSEVALAGTSASLHDMSTVGVESVSRTPKVSFNRQWLKKILTTCQSETQASLALPKWRHLSPLPLQVAVGISYEMDSDKYPLQASID